MSHPSLEALLPHRPCTGCRRGYFSRSHRRGLDHVLSWLGLHPFRCWACGLRAYHRVD